MSLVYYHLYDKILPLLKEACPKTKFQDSLGYRSIIVIPTMQKASFGFLFQRNCSRSPRYNSGMKVNMLNLQQLWCSED